MGTTFDAILTVAALVLGVMMLLGKGDFLLADKNSASRNREYDMKKAQRGFGIMLLVVGVATGINMLFTSTLSYVIYIVVVIVAFAAGIIYMKKFCRK